MLAPAKFPNPTELERVSTLQKFRRLYEGEHYPVLGLHKLIKEQYEKEADIVYLAHNLPAYISDFYGDFVAGDSEQMTIRGNTGKAEIDEYVEEVVFENDLKERIVDIGAEQSQFGFVPMLGRLDADKIWHIESVPQDQYFPQADGSVVFATYKKDYSNPLSVVLLCYTQHYQLVGQDCVITRKAWECDEKGVLTKEIALERILPLLGIPEVVVEEKLVGLGELPIRQVDNTRRTRWGFGKSDYFDIIPQLAEINERSTHIATQLLKNLTAKMQLPDSMFDEDGNVEKFEAIAIASKEDPEAKYVINENPLIADARNHIIDQVKMVSLVTSVPMWELLKTAMPERVEGMRMQMFSAVRKTDRKRARVKRALNDLFRIGAKLKGIELDEDIDIQFSDVLPTDDLIKAQTEETKVRSGLSSRKSAIMRLENLDPEEADEELTQIRNEDKIAGIGGEPPALDANTV